jgi:murein DD-endopeptidase MepM/ murein hydrolase activator NlpD
VASKNRSGSGSDSTHWRTGCGNSLTIDHGNGEYSVLMHLQGKHMRHRVGDRVEQGEVVGRIGNSGDSYGPHLHYSLQDSPRLFDANALPFGFSNTDGAALAPGNYFEAK